jgi:hypothetical protein
MPWDDELERLTLSVLDLFGEDALTAAIRRATMAALQQAQPIDVSAPVDVSGITSRDGSWTSMSACYDALRLELRRLVRPH